ncbi:hypothetical protein I552_0875 [Mycobacterium xenopi 3993]|nr:hypothetical protein I552_0875 [Mycobacterium xenopi 3993]
MVRPRGAAGLRARAGMTLLSSVGAAAVSNGSPLAGRVVEDAFQTVFEIGLVGGAEVVALAVI